MRIHRAVRAVCILALSAAAAAGASGSSQPPRKVIVGTAMQRFWVVHPGLEKRLEELGGIIDRMAAESQRKYGRGLDLAVLPEAALTGEIGRDIVAGSFPLAGAVREAFSRMARRHKCYIVAPLYLLEDRDKRLVSNAAVLFGREGEVAGIYRKLHLAVPAGSDSLENGTTPGREVPVFQCDFGKLGIQICFDMSYEYGWKELARQGADLVVWPTQSPQTSQPAFRARQGRYYIVSSTWRNNASIFEPTGKIAAQIREPQQVLVEELDLSYAILGWSRNLANGAALRKRYGQRVGFRYYEDEDLGIFWSNDPAMPVGRMAESIGVMELDAELRRIRELYRRAGVPGLEPRE
ncbi:MAG: carbon-nitrogen hydrolase family protein [Bryobacterales bacterium]|nr:carbon-nitrogen hydrolase family protein [Bryobacterales bacterium]